MVTLAALAMMGVFLTTSPTHVVAGVLCLATSPAQVCVVIVGAFCSGAFSTRVCVGEPVVPCLIVALLLRASAYDCMALATSASLFMVDIKLCIELGEKVFQVWGCGFLGVKFGKKSCSVMHVGKVED